MVIILFDNVMAKVVVFRDINVSAVKDNSIFEVPVFEPLSKGARAIA